MFPIHFQKETVVFLIFSHDFFLMLSFHFASWTVNNLLQLRSISMFKLDFFHFPDPAPQPDNISN